MRRYCLCRQFFAACDWLDPDKIEMMEMDGVSHAQMAEYLQKVSQVGGPQYL